MGGADRVDVLCAASLEGPGASRWSTCELIIVAMARAGRFSVQASLSEGAHDNRRISWNLLRRHRSEQEAVERVRAMVANPAEFFAQGRVKGDTAAVEERLQGLTLKTLVDTTQGAAELDADALTVGLGRYLADEVERGVELSPQLSGGIARYFAKAPFRYGYWAPYKRLIKLLENCPGAETLLAVALVRIDGRQHHVANDGATDWLWRFVPPDSPDLVAGVDTLAYLMRRGRRWLRRLGRVDPAGYVRCAAAILEATDAQRWRVQTPRWPEHHGDAGATDPTSDTPLRWILSDILYGSGIEPSRRGHGTLGLPQNRYRKRRDRFPRAWDTHLDVVRGLWRKTCHHADIQAWAFEVLVANHQAIPELDLAGLRIALRSPSPRLRAHALQQVLARPERLLELDADTVRRLIESSSKSQFATVFSMLESHAHVGPFQEAVLAYLDDYGLPEILRGELTECDDKRVLFLLDYALRHLRSRFDDAETEALVRYVGQVTRFRPPWLETFRSLPLDSRIALRLSLPDLPPAVKRSIDDDLLPSLAARCDAQQTVETLVRLVDSMAGGKDARGAALLRKLIALDPAITQCVWTSVGSEQFAWVAQMHLASRALAEALVAAVDAEEIRTIGAAQAEYLLQALRLAPSRLNRDRGFTVACALCPHPALQQLAIARLESRRMVSAVFVPLAESGMPSAVAAAERHVASIKGRAELTRAVITLCDSGARAARALGLRFIEKAPDRLDLPAVSTALAEHTSPEVMAVVAGFAADGVAIRRDALDAFDNRVLRTRRAARKARELVKRRLSVQAPPAATSAIDGGALDARRLQALVDMARSSSLRDRDWALQQLARLALSGQPIAGLQVDTTS